MFLIALVAIVFFFFLPSRDSTKELEISQVVERAQVGEISEIEVEGDKLTVRTVAGEEFESRKEASTSILDLLREAGVATGSSGVQVTIKDTGFNFGGLLLSFLPLILFVSIVRE